MHALVFGKITRGEYNGFVTQSFTLHDEQYLICHEVWASDQLLDSLESYSLARAIFWSHTYPCLVVLPSSANLTVTRRHSLSLTASRNAT